MNEDKKDEVILSYHDCLLRRSDLNLLEGPHWINDALIGFYFEYLSKSQELPNFSKILYVCPELTQLLKMTDLSEVSIFLDPLNSTQKNFIFFPLNNCEHRNSAGGSHWSLLVFSKMEKTFYHFDSFKMSNEDIARTFAKNVSKYLMGSEGKFVEANCPQQDNGYDCGLFVLCFTDILAQHISTHPKIVGCNFGDVKRAVSAKRKDLLHLISSLNCDN